MQIIPSAKNIKANLAGAINGDVASAGDHAGGIFGSKLVGAIKGILASAALGKAISKSITAGGELQQSLGGIETLFKENADAVITAAQSAYKEAGMSANEYMEAVTGFSASLIQSMGGDTKAAAEMADIALKDMSDNANKMGSDMESIKNAYQGFAKQNYTMLDNLKLGYGGTKSEMERLLADAQKLTGVKYDISNLADVYSAIHVIQGELGIAGATALEAESTLTGSFGAMKAAFTDFLGNLALGRDVQQSLENLTDSTTVFLGKNLLPAVGRVLSGLPTVVRGAFSAAVKGLNAAADNADTIVQQGKELVMGVGDAIISALPSLAGAAVKLAGSFIKSIVSEIDGASPSMLDAGFQLLGEVSSGLLQGLPELIEAAAEISDSLLASILEAIPEMLDSGVVLAASFAQGIGDNFHGVLEVGSSMIASLLDTIATFLPDILISGADAIQDFALGLLSEMPSVIGAAQTILDGLMESILYVLPDILDAGFRFLEGFSNGLLDGLPGMIESITEIVDSLLSELLAKLPSLLDMGTRMTGNFAQGLADNLPAVLEAASSMLFSLLDTLLAYLPDLLDSGVSAVNSFVTGLLNSLPSVISGAGEILVGLLGFILDALPDFLDAGMKMIGNLAFGLLDNLPAIISSIGEVLASLRAKIGEHLPELLQKGIELIGQLAAGLIRAIPKILKAIPQIITSLKDAFGKYDWGEIGKNIISGIAKGIKNYAGTLLKAAKDAASEALGSVKKFLGINSPSRRFRDEVGAQIPPGAAIGIKENTKPLVEAMEDLSDLAVDSFAVDLQYGAKVAPAAAPAASYGGHQITINVYGSPNQDENELAEIVIAKLDTYFSRREACFA